MPETAEKRRVYSRTYYEKNKEAIKAKTRAYALAHPEQTAAYKKAWKKANPEKANAWAVANHERVKARIRKSKRKLSGAIAPTGETRTGKCDIAACDYVGPLVWDHCHVTGVFRGWLCQACNKALGGFRDSPALLRSAADYQEKFLTAQSADAKLVE